MKVQHTSMVTGEENHYQALADAIILLAVRDYRSASRMLHTLRVKARKHSKNDEADLAYLQARIRRYHAMREDAASFLCSDLFGHLCDLDGNALLNDLKKEVYQ